MKIVKVIFFCSFFVVCSCSTVGVVNYQTDQVKAKATKAENIKTYAFGPTEREYEIIGQVIVSADAGRNSKIVVDKMKQQASKLGADALIDLRLEIEYGYFATGIKGTSYAIKFKN